MALITKGAVDKLIALAKSNQVQRTDIQNIYNALNQEAATRKEKDKVLSLVTTDIEYEETEGSTMYWKATWDVSDMRGVVVPWCLVRQNASGVANDVISSSATAKQTIDLRQGLSFTTQVGVTITSVTAWILIP